MRRLPFNLTVLLVIYIYIKYTQIYIYHCPASEFTVRFTQIYIKYNFYINFSPDAKRQETRVSDYIYR